ncbi:MAG: hypothetical protein J6A28_00815 [Clostridia bacterium]|nr:hypothetical protein [Clostridia bacterium]
MIWWIIAGCAVVLIASLVLTVILAKKKGKKNAKKLDENISKFKTEKEEIEKKEQADAEEKKEKEAFKNITLTEDVEEEFKDLFQPHLASVKEKDDFDFPELSKADFSNSKFNDFDDDFFKNLDKPSKKSKALTRDEEFEQFLNEHSFSRRVLDKDILDEIKSLSPKMKAIVLGNVFNKFDE